MPLILTGEAQALVVFAKVGKILHLSYKHIAVLL